MLDLCNRRLQMNVATVPTEPTQVARSPTTSLVMSSDTSLGGRHRLVEPERRWCIHLADPPGVDQGVPVAAGPQPDE